MHEIPNLPFPSLHETEQPTPQQASPSSLRPKKQNQSTANARTDAVPDRVESAPLRAFHTA